MEEEEAEVEVEEEGPSPLGHQSQRSSNPMNNIEMEYTGAFFALLVLCHLPRLSHVSPSGGGDDDDTDDTWLLCPTGSDHISLKTKKKDTTEPVRNGRNQIVITPV